MEWIIAGLAVLFTGITSAAISYNQKQDEIEYNRRQEANKAASSYLSALESGWVNIDDAQKEIDNLNDTIADLEWQMDNDKEFVDAFNQILNGDRTGSEEARELFKLESQIANYQRQEALAQKSAQDYLVSSALEKAQAHEQGLQTYKELAGSSSMANVYASARGEQTGSYTVAALESQNSLRKFVGDDMKFNTVENAEGRQTSSLGTFASQYLTLASDISRQIQQNNDTIWALNTNIQASKGDVDTFKENLQEQYEGITDSERGSLAIAQESIDENKGTIDTKLDLINQYKNNAINALKNYRENAKIAGISDDEINKNIERVNEEYKKRGLDFTDQIDTWKEEDKKAAEEAERKRKQAEEEAKRQRKLEEEQRAREEELRRKKREEEQKRKEIIESQKVTMDEKKDLKKQQQEAKKKEEEDKKKKKNIVTKPSSSKNKNKNKEIMK